MCQGPSKCSNKREILQQQELMSRWDLTSTKCNGLLPDFFRLLKELTSIPPFLLGFPDSSVGKESTYNAGDIEPVNWTWFNSWVGKIRWRRDRLPTPVFLGFPCGSTGKESAYNVGDLGSIPGWVGKIPWRRERLPTQVFWPGEFHGLYSPWGPKESDTIERLPLHFTSLLPPAPSYRQIARMLGTANHISFP